MYIVVESKLNIDVMIRKIYLKIKKRIETWL